MIDIHNHMLPGIDDGAQSLEESIALARAAVANGITHCVCTPHINFGRFDNTHQSIGSAFFALSEVLKREAIPLKLGWAAEVRFDVEIISAIEEQRVPFLGVWGGRSVLLLEFPSGEFPLAASRFVEILLDLGVVPLIAHPERNRGLLRHPERLHSLLDQGCLLQITAASLVGGFGARAERLALSLLDSNLVTVIATDAHHSRRRPPLLREAFKRVAELYGHDRAVRLTVEQPWSIVQRKFE
jgi:protein-tyrosine phosphatase